MEPSGYLPLKVTPIYGDRLILYPVYLCPVEILERGVMILPSYYRWIVTVNAFNRRIKLLETENITVCQDFDISSFDVRQLDVRVSPKFAEELAGFGAIPDDFRSWRKMLRSRKTVVNADKLQLVWHIFAVRDGQVTDTFSGETALAASLADTLFS